MRMKRNRLPGLLLEVLDGGASLLERRVLRLLEGRLPWTRRWRVISAGVCVMVLGAASAGVGVLTVRPTAVQAASMEEMVPEQGVMPAGGMEIASAGGPEFDVASVKENRTHSHDMQWGCRGTDGQTLSEVAGSKFSLMASSSIPPGRCVVHNVPLQWVIALAYGIPWDLENQVILGGPSWVSEGLDSPARFDIEAETDQPATRAQMLAMLQALLAKRFAMKLHLEERPQPVFELVMAKKGVRLTKAPADRDCAKVIAGEPLCHEFTGGFGSGLTGRSVTMEELATRLSRYTGRPVLNKTDVDGVYDVKTSDFWMPFPDEKDRGVQSIFQMLEDQLGLHLKAAKDPFQVLVVDAAEMPKSSEQ